MAQRMESVAPAGGVMLSEPTARLVEDTAVLGEPELVHIKGSDDPVLTYRLLAIGVHQRRRRSESKLVGREWEFNTLTGILGEAISGAGCVVNIVGPPGIGKSRLVRETADIAAGRGVSVFGTYCESHTSDIPFHVIARLLRAAMEIDEHRGRRRAGPCPQSIPGREPRGSAAPRRPAGYPRFDGPSTGYRPRRTTSTADRIGHLRLTRPARAVPCTSSRTHTGSTTRVNRCLPTSCRSSRRSRRWS